jgi:tetratricopeptide (TPR) repeat protein
MFATLRPFCLALLLAVFLLLGSSGDNFPKLLIQTAEAGAITSGDLELLYQGLENIFRDGFEATQRGDFAQAEELWTLAIEIYPANPAAWSNRGNARVSQFRLQEAIADFDQAIELVPDLPDPYINRGTAWEGLGEWEQAIADYDRAIALNPKDPVAYNNRGNALGSIEDWQGALTNFTIAKDLAPGFALASTNYALALYQLGDVAESTRWLKNLVRKYAAFADPRAALTAVLWAQGQQGEAESNWYPVVGLDPRYKDLDWLREIRRWPPALLEEIDSFLTLH